MPRWWLARRSARRARGRGLCVPEPCASSAYFFARGARGGRRAVRPSEEVSSVLVSRVTPEGALWVMAQEGMPFGSTIQNH